ncbi:MAG: ferritin-like domain-containing protein [Rhodospirillales bacterium]
MRLNSLEDLFLRELQGLFDVENQLVKALPEMADKSSSTELQNAIREHYEQTKNQVRRLEQVFENLGYKAKSEKSEGIRGIISEGEDMADMEGESAAIDAGIIAAAQKVEHFEIAGYGTVCAYAKTLGHEQALHLLKQTLEEEKTADRKLTELAERLINVDAVRAAGGQARTEL